MKTAILTSHKEADLELLIQLARKLGIQTRPFNYQETEDLGLIYAMEAGKTDEYVDTEEYLKKLRS